ncbi:Amino acid ABC transporter, permease protein MetI-like [Desulfonema limicola]|uniref:Amino acid ABC transporter, permease protein MetI-like n=1 Tax=Desulfonema limicola TaxID=45656 RepID=A0A975GHL4_9BACT|nr:amino acid ABC transporter permease [Desulfonema limicola]QTA81537.1 Amino acid ABC transporter, permease protein MetI-like [Desulfonema limicola]
MLEAFNFRVLFEYMPLYMKCFMATLWLSGISLAGAIFVGIIASAMRLGRFKILSILAGMYIEIIRSTPLLAQLYFMYFGLPSLGILVSEEVTGITALTLNSGAYMAEIIRAGIQSIPKGQVEAGISSGLNYFQRMRHIILPQALGVTIQPLLGQSIVLVKDSSLLSLISIMELTRAGQVLTSERFMPAEGYLATAVFYLVIYYMLKTITNWSQKKLIFREAGR